MGFSRTRSFGIQLRIPVKIHHMFGTGGKEDGASKSTAIHTTLFVRFLYDMHHRIVHMRENTKEATGFSSDERRTQQCRTRSGSVLLMS
jgi:hypothetical protein